MTLVSRLAGHRVGAQTETKDAGVYLRTKRTVITQGAVSRGDRVVAHTGRRIADDLLLTFIVGQLALDRALTDADATLACVELGTGVPIITEAPFFFVLIQAMPGQWVAHTLSLALVGRATDHRISAHAGAGLTGVRLSTHVAIITGRR
jgi:hypothetical protein